MGTQWQRATCRPPVQGTFHIASVSADPKLVALIHDPRKRVRQELVVALGRSDDRTAVETLLPILRDPDETLRTLAIQALGRLGGEKARHCLRSFLTDKGSTDKERAFVRNALATTP